MPVTGATTRNDYVASSGQTVFSYTFQILLATDIKVLKNGTVLTFNNDYTVSNVGVAGGGNVTLTSGASEDDIINIFLAMPIDRTTEYQNAGDFLASDVNGDFDKGYIAMNQLQTDIKRAIALADADPTVDLTLPLKSIRANKYLKFNALGQVTVTDSASTNTSADLGLANALDYNVVGDGVADDTVAARNCISAAIQNDLIAYFPPGNYRITGNIMNYQKLVDGGKSPKIVGAGRGLTKFTIDGTQSDFVFKAYGDTTSYGSSSHPSGLLFQGFSVIGDYTNTQNIFDLAMLSYFGFDDVNTFQCKGTSLRMRECWEGDLSGLRIVRSGDDSVYAVLLDYYFSDRKADSACNNINFGKDFQCEASAWSAMYWGRNTRKCLFQGKIHPLLSSTYTVPAFVMDGATNCTVIGANISWKNVKSLRITNASGYIPSENIVTNSTISGGVELVGACRRNTIVYNTGGISKQQNAYIATSGQTVFAYTFLAAATKNVLVTKNGEELVLDTDYTLTGLGDAGGGDVTLTVGATTGDDVVVSQVEDQFVTIAGGADNIVFGNNPSGAGVEVTYASGSNLLPTVFHGKDTVATFESNDTFARVEFVEPNGSSRVGTQASKLILEAAHTGDPSNSKVSFQIAGNEVAKIDNNGNITANNMPVSVETFGVVSDGVTDNTVALQSAIDSAANDRRPLYFPASSSFIKVTGPIYVRSYSRWFGEGEIKNTNTEGNINSAVLMPGAFNPVYFDPYNPSVTGYTHYPINAVNSGRTITTTTASDAGNFSAGDLVWVSTVTTWVGNAGDYPITAHLSEVVSANASTGDVVLDTPISEEMADLYGSLRVCKAEDANISDINGNPLEFCKYATIDGISITAPDGAALTRGGMYKCDFNFKDVRAKNAIFANAFVNTSVRAQTVTASRKACDIAGFSNSFYIGIDSLIYDGQLAESNLPAFCRVGECGRNGVIESFNANCGGYIDPDPIVMIDGGSKNVGQIHHSVVAPDHGTETSTGAAFRFQQAVSSNRQIYIASPAWTGSTAFALNDRVVNGGNGYQCITAGTSAASGGPTGTGSSITDGTVVWKYVTNVASIGDTVLNYGTTFDDQGADRTATLKVYLNNIIVPEGAGAGKYTKTDSNTTITLGTALVADDRVKIGLDSDYQKSTEDCWMDINATLGSSAARGAFFADSAQDAIPPTLHHIKRCGFKNLKIDAPSDAFAGTNQAVNVDGEHSYIDDALINSGKISVSTYADYATIRGYYEEGVTNNSPNSNVRITSKRSLLCDVGNQINDQILIQTTATTAALTAVFPADSLYIDDRWIINGTGRITGTNGEKNILFYDDDTVFFTFTIPAGTTGNFSIQLQLIPQSLTQYTAFGVLNVEGAGSVSYDTDTSINYGTPTTFKVGASVANTSDGVRFHNLDSTFTKPYHLN